MERIFYIQLSEDCTTDELAKLADRLRGAPISIDGFVLGTTDTVEVSIRNRTVSVVINWADGIEVGSIIRKGR